MRLTELKLEGYRGFTKEKVKFDPRLTILVGANGSGKSSVLDAIFLMLSQYSARLVGSRASAQRLKETDIRVRSAETRIHLEIGEPGVGQVRWTLLKQGPRERVLKPLSSEFSSLNDFVKVIAERTGGADYLRGEVLPIYYDQSRVVLRIPKRHRVSTRDDSAESAFRDSMGASGIDFPALTYWFQDRETDELRRQRSRRGYVDRELEAVRRAMTTATGLKNPYFNVDRPRGLTFEKDKTPLHVSQLSTGERVFLALAGDLARRLAAISKPEDNPLDGRAIVLIDEVELHLHPKWQRTIAPWLLKTFPNCQFIVSTHSPQVVSEVEAEHIRILVDSPKGTRVTSARWTKGRDSNHLLATIFDTAEREASADQLIRQADAAITESKFDKAQSLIGKLEQAIEGAPPEVALLQARLARRRSK